MPPLPPFVARFLAPPPASAVVTSGKPGDPGPATIMLPAAQRPASALPGQRFYATDTKIEQLWDGVAWQNVGGAGHASGPIAGTGTQADPFTIPAGTFDASGAAAAVNLRLVHARYGSAFSVPITGAITLASNNAPHAVVDTTGLGAAATAKLPLISSVQDGAIARVTHATKSAAVPVSVVAQAPDTIDGGAVAAQTIAPGAQGAWTADVAGGTWRRLDAARDVVSVHDFGAVGDGVADDTAAIQAAVAAVAALPSAAHKTLWFPAGKYKFTVRPVCFTAVSNLRVAGAGRYASQLIDARPAGNAVGADAVVGATYGGVFSFLTCSNIELVDVGLISVATPFTNPAINTGKKGVWAHDVTDFAVRRVYTENTEGEAIYVENHSHRITFEGCYVNGACGTCYNLAMAQPYGDDCRIVDCRGRDSQAGLVEATGTSCVFEGNHYTMTAGHAMGCDIMNFDGLRNLVVANNVVEDCDTSIAGVSPLDLSNFEGTECNAVITGNVFARLKTGSDEGAGHAGIITVNFLFGGNNPGTTLITGNVITGCGRAGFTESVGITVRGAQANIPRVVIEHNTIAKGTGYTNIGIWVDSTVPSPNKIEIGVNTFDAGITIPHKFNTAPALAPAGATSARPTFGLYPGRMYFDTTLDKPVWWDGAAWRDATGTAV